MRKFLLCLILTPLLTFSQGRLIIIPGTSVVLSGGTSFAVDRLVLTPSSNFSMGQNNQLRNESVSHTIAYPYIRRVYHYSSNVVGFSGSISFYYRDDELNGISESSIVLNV